LITAAIIAASLLWSPAPAAESDITISAEISSASMAFDARDTLIVRIVWQGEPFLYQIDDFPMPDLEKLEILGSSSSVSTITDSTAEAGEITIRTFTYILQPTDFGTGIISPLNITAKNQVNDEAHELKTGRLTVEIDKPTAPVEETSGGSILIIILFAVVFIGGIVAFLIIRNRREKSEKKPVDLSYLEALKEIKKETVADRKLFYARLYRLLLNYLEKECHLEITGKTGEEILAAVGQIENEADRAGLMQWISQAQKIKYQPEAPSAGDVEKTYQSVNEFFESKLSPR